MVGEGTREDAETRREVCGDADRDDQRWVAHVFVHPATRRTEYVGGDAAPQAAVQEVWFHRWSSPEKGVRPELRDGNRELRGDSRFQPSPRSGSESGFRYQERCPRRSVPGLQ